MYYIRDFYKISCYESLLQFMIKSSEHLNAHVPPLISDQQYTKIHFHRYVLMVLFDVSVHDIHCMLISYAYGFSVPYAYGYTIHMSINFPVV